MRKIRRAVSHVLALFPFEVPLYEAAKVPVTFVGHPLADMLPLEPDHAGAKREMKLASDKLVIAMLPGSRQSELQYLADTFVKTAMRIHQQVPESQFLVPLVTRETRWQFEEAIRKNEAYEIPFTLLFGRPSGHGGCRCGGRLELPPWKRRCKRPMVITYRMSPFSW